jgi:hypothetical protein
MTPAAEREGAVDIITPLISLETNPVRPVCFDDMF